ncbi:hypothetical protein T4B_8341 [Trichinella pseudospiralis]|uniref:Uncharacterized protein n=2 Tax=Trichinella pseudospiralis TaxID=6337 RepID=A0A0V1E3Y9_TRIPS|nr:hypothetical protein T4A_2707 [Trichinella pseudospiralis]KRY84147.1 hypothetical protein T4D_13305 [Trichinella pseudospiralis]KRZ27421.1 hypothetical protein T4B_8341 [Trichinella pseudospiralis]
MPPPKLGNPVETIRSLRGMRTFYGAKEHIDTDKNSDPEAELDSSAAPIIFSGFSAVRLSSFWWLSSISHGVSFDNYVYVAANVVPRIIRDKT